MWKKRIVFVGGVTGIVVLQFWDISSRQIQLFILHSLISGAIVDVMSRSRIVPVSVVMERCDAAERVLGPENYVRRRVSRARHFDTRMAVFIPNYVSPKRASPVVVGRKKPLIIEDYGG